MKQCNNNIHIHAKWLTLSLSLSDHVSSCSLQEIIIICVMMHVTKLKSAVMILPALLCANDCQIKIDLFNTKPKLI